VPPALAPPMPLPPPPAVAAPAAPHEPAPPPPPAPWWTQFSADAFVDAYGAVNWNLPKPQFGMNTGRAFDQATGFSLNAVGVNVTYAAGPIGGTISLRLGPGAALYNSPVDNRYGLEYVRQAFATAKFGSFTLDAGKFDEPFGSEVPDSQLNMSYTRSLLFQLNQPLFFTGLRLDFAPAQVFDAKLIVANGWNNSIDDNAGKTVAAQIAVKPADSVQLSVGYAGGPEAADTTTMNVIGPAGLVSVPSSPAFETGANANWRHLVDFVADVNPTKVLRFLANADYDTETFAPGVHAVWYGANLAIRYAITDPFSIVVRGEYWGDKHGSIIDPNGLVAAGHRSTAIGSGTLTLSYVIAGHYTLMLDNRVDGSNARIFPTTSSASKTQFTSTLGIIASTR